MQEVDMQKEGADNVLEKPTSPDSGSSNSVSPKYSSKGVILVPQPTDDPRDPYNWPIKRKLLVFSIICLSSFSGLASGTAHLSSIVIQAKDYHVSPNAQSYSISSVVAGLMAGPFIFAPLAQVVGVSSCIFWALIGAMLGNIWGGKSTAQGDYYSFIVSRLLGGFFCSVPQILGNGVIVNIFFLHQRGKAFAAYSTLYILGTTAGPTFGAFIIASVNWPVEYWWLVALQAVLIVLVFLFLEETGFPRDGKAYPRAPEGFLAKRVATFFPGNRVVPGVSAKRLGLFYAAPFLIGISPVTVIAGLLQLVGFGWYVTISSEISIFLQEPLEVGGYGFTPTQNGAFNFSLWFAILAAQVWGQALNDRLPIWLCKRRGGFWQPEYRLQTLWVPSLIIMPIGLGLFGASLKYHLHFMVLALGSFFITFAATAAVPVTVNYVVENFRGHPQEVGTLMNGYRLLLGLVVPFFLQPWTKAVGIDWVFGMMAFFSIFSFLMVTILFWKGRQIARYSLKSVASNEDEKVLEKPETTGAKAAASP